MKRLFSSPLPRIVSSLALLAALAFGTSNAHADEAAGAEHAKQARIAYDLQDWGKAIAEFRAAYESEQKPEYLWALAQAQRMNQDWSGAIASYKAFKRLDVSTSQANAAELQITKCEAEKAKQEAAAAIQASHAQQKKKPAETSQPAPTKPASEKPAPEPEAPKPRHWYSDVFGHVLFFSGLAVAGAGGYFLVTGNSDVGDTSGSYDAALERRDSGKKKQVIGAGGLVVGGALMAGGVVRYLVVGNGESPEADHGTAVGFAVLPNSAAVAISGSF
jgi:hypothetical protein